MPGIRLLRGTWDGCKPMQIRTLLYIYLNDLAHTQYKTWLLCNLGLVIIFHITTLDVIMAILMYYYDKHKVDNVHFDVITALFISEIVL